MLQALSQNAERLVPLIMALAERRKSQEKALGGAVTMNNGGQLQGQNGLLAIQILLEVAVLS